MLVSGVLDPVSVVLQDTSRVTYTAAQLIDVLNESLRALVLVRPDASAVTASMLLTANTTLQTLPAATDLRLIDVDCNLGSDGATVGDALRLGDKQALNSFLPGWRSVAGTAVIKEYVFDDARPDEFEVYPRPHATTPVYVRVNKSVLPTVVTAVGDALPVKDSYAPALKEYCCYLAFSRDSENTPNWQRAARHYASFFNLLQIKMTADMKIDPRIREAVAAQK